MGEAIRILAVAASLAATAGCSKEARTLASDAPLSAPRSAADPRIPIFQANAYQISQGGRYFAWYGCASCHDADAMGWRDLGDGRWKHGGGFDQVYRVIAERHGDIGARLPEQQRWQITAYVRDLSQQQREKRVRQDRDAAGEPAGTSWTGQLR